MPTALEQAIASLTDPAVAVGDALRGLMVVSRRIRATEASDWLAAELGGYDSGQELPEYRTASLPIRLGWDGFGGSRDAIYVTNDELPEQLRMGEAGTRLHQPVAELAALADGSGDSNPQLPLPLSWVVLYRHFVDEGGNFPHLERMVLNRADVIVPKTFLRGLLDQVKTAALDLALDLEAVAVDAGSAGGPTVESNTELASAVHVHMNTIYASNSSVVVGDGNVAVQIQVGDIGAVLDAAREFVSEEGVDALRVALEADGGSPGGETRSFLDNVKAGAVLLAGGMVTNGAYDGLVALLGQAFPGFS